MARIFISYRRADSQANTDRIYSDLRRAFGRRAIFKDVDDIPPGVDFPTYLADKIQDAKVVLVIIGRTWSSIADENGNRRLDDPRDFVRVEVEAALKLKNARVIPILVNDAKMPAPENVPESLRRITRLNAMTVRNDPDFYNDSRRLVRKLRELGIKRVGLSGVQIASLAVAIVSVMLVVMMLLSILNGGNGGGDITPTEADSAIAGINTETPTDEPIPDISEDDARATGAAQAYATLTALAPTDTPTISPTPTNTPISSSDIQQTAQAEIFATGTVAAQTEVVIAQATQEAVLTEQFSAGATATYIVQLSLTPPATDTATATHTPTATATNTPRPTATPRPTNTPDPIQAAFIPVTRNDDWTPIEREFDGVVMVLVPAGSFVMGSTEEEIEAAFALCNEIDRDNNCPRSWFEPEARNGDNTQVFDEPFWIDKYEVTRGQYQACVDAGVCSSAQTSDFSSEPEQPINRVTWFEAQTYCEWAGGRLPTEAEWEYAARGPDGLIYPWGNEFSGTEANHCDVNCAEASWASGYRWTQPENDDGHAITAPVGSYPQGASWVGAMDMAGNVWNWTSSLFEPYPYDAGDGRENASSSSARVLRGGSFSGTTFYLRAAVRSWFDPNYEINYGGFRCARSS